MINYIEFSSKNGFNDYLESLWWSFNAVVTGGFVDIYNPKRKTHIMYEKALNRANQLNTMKG